jgi:hypothetical protein
MKQAIETLARTYIGKREDNFVRNGHSGERIVEEERNQLMAQ